MSPPKQIREGMVVKNRGGEPLGRVISVDDDGFVLERKVIVTRELRVSLDEVHALEDHGVVLDHAHGHRHLEEEDLSEVFWSARRARDERRPLSEREVPPTGVSHRVVAVTKHAEAYPVQVERGTVRAPRYLPLSEEQFRRAAPAHEEPHSLQTHGEAPVVTPSERQPRSPWSRGVRRYAARSLIVATSLFDKLRGAWSSSAH